MNISILGSCNKKKSTRWPCRDRDNFVNACNTLGNAILEGGHLLLVDEEASENTATWHTFTALRDSIRSHAPAKPCIGIIDPNKRGSKYQDLVRKIPGMWIEVHSHLVGRERRRVFQLIRSDSVVFLGGRNSTYQLALTAGRKQHIVHIGSFGGAAAKFLREQMEELPGELSDHAHSLRLLSGPWNQELQDHVLGLLGMSDTTKLLIIHGHGAEHYKLKDLLQNRLKVAAPVIMKDDNNLTSLTLPEKFEYLASNARAAIAIVTGDDIGRLASTQQSADFNYRARQNVWLEVGWFWGRLGRSRFMLLCKDETEIPSDLQGVEYVRYHDSPMECLETIQKFVERVRYRTHGRIGNRRGEDRPRSGPVAVDQSFAAGQG